MLPIALRLTCHRNLVNQQDSIFEDISYDGWKSSLRPKVTGSWNLHKSLLKDLEFFILLSSSAGIGGLRGQANYAAGNTFMDSLAHHRNACGQRVISIDLGARIPEGPVAENAILRERILGSGNLIPLTQAMFLAPLEHYCNPELEISPSFHSQPIVGIKVPRNIRGRKLAIYTIVQPILAGRKQ